MYVLIPPSDPEVLKYPNKRSMKGFTGVMKKKGPRVECPTLGECQILSTPKYIDTTRHVKVVDLDTVRT